MSAVNCCVCGSGGDCREMLVCPDCQSYVCSDCYRDHRLDCEQDDE